MQLSRNIKQNGTTGIIGVVTVVAHLILMMYGNPQLEYANSLQVDPSQDIVSLLNATDKNIVPVEITAVGVLKHTESLPLQGALDLAVRVGDVIIFRKTKGNWAEVGRYLAD